MIREWLMIVLALVLTFIAAVPLGRMLADIAQGRIPLALRWLAPLERACYRSCGIDPRREMSWQAYATSFVALQLVGFIALFALLMCQQLLPLNPRDFPGMPTHLAFNTAVSFVTNTNWQAYAGEATLSVLSQMAGLAVQDFVSAASGIAVLFAIVRALSRSETPTLGNFWVDLVRVTLYVLLPLAFVLALVLVSQGVVQTFDVFVTIQPLDDAAGTALNLGPVASQVAIKQLGTNGGGYFNVNSTHPFENPTWISNLFELGAIVLIPAALCHTFGAIVGDKRQGWALFAVMLAILVPCMGIAAWAEHQPLSWLQAAGVEGVNLEGKEARFGMPASVAWSVATTAASNGSVNAMHDSLTPLGGMVPMLLMQLGEVVFGGVGSGLYGMLAFVVVAVFTAGLMIGRTPEYLGKKLEVFEMKMAVVAIMAPTFVVLIGTAWAVTSEAGVASISNPGVHGFSQVLYAFSSAGNNNGSAFAGLDASTSFYTYALGFAMLVGRYGVALPMLALAGSLARKKRVAEGAGTLPTHGIVFAGFLAVTILVVGALTFLPALALGPGVEHLLHSETRP